MRTNGPDEASRNAASRNGASLRIVDASAGAGRAQSLKAGAVVSVQVREYLGRDAAQVGTTAGEAQIYRVAIGSRVLVATSSSPLMLGSTLRARIENSGGTLLLKIQEPRTAAAAARLPSAQAAAVVSSAGLPADAASFSALAALLREGISPQPRALSRVRRAALGDRADAIDLAARMEAKGMPAEGEALELLVEACAGSRPGGDRGRDARDGAGDGDGTEDRGWRDAAEDRPEADASTASLETAAAGLDLERDFERGIPETELAGALAAFLRGLSMRAAGDIPGGSGHGEALALFNHLRGPEGSWVIVPFRFGLDAIDFAGSFRIQLPYARGGAGRLEASFTASRGAVNEEWAASLSFGGGRASSLALVPPKGRGGGVRLRRLAAELATLSCGVRFGTVDEAVASGAEGLDLDA